MRTSPSVQSWTVNSNSIYKSKSSNKKLHNFSSQTHLINIQIENQHSSNISITKQKRPNKSTKSHTARHRTAQTQQPRTTTLNYNCNYATQQIVQSRCENRNGYRSSFRQSMTPLSLFGGAFCTCPSAGIRMKKRVKRWKKSRSKKGASRARFVSVAALQL